MRRQLVLLACLLAGFLAVGSFFCQMANPAPPAMAAIPTPVAEVAGGGDWVMAEYSIGGDFIDVYDTATGSAIHDPAYTVVDLSWTLDVSGTIYVTCTLEFSNDSSNWADGEDIVGNASADVTNMDQFNLHGRYSRAKCTESGGADLTNTYTATLIGKLMN